MDADTLTGLGLEVPARTGASRAGAGAKVLAGWLLLLASGLFVLTGRFEWSPGSFPYSLRSWVLSAYLFALLCPTLFYLLVYLMGSRSRARWITGATSVLFLFPYHWLGLDRFYYHLDHTIMTSWKAPGMPVPKPDWFPHAASAGMPHATPFFLSLFALGVAVITLWCRSNFSSTKRIPSRGWAIACAILALMLVESWIHLSLRSPYTYLPHYEQPAQLHYWYHYYLFPDTREGAVNLDYHTFRPAEELFMGLPKDTGILVNRVLPEYLASQFTFFFNPFYVWLVLNIACWGIAVFVTYCFCSRLFDRRVGLISAILTASAQSVILYVAQPKIYTIALCAIVMVVWLHHRLFHERPFRPGYGILFGAVLSLFFLCYEVQPWLVAFLCIGLFLRLDKPWTFLSVAMAVLIPAIFVKLCRSVGHVSVIETLATDGGNPVENIKQLVIHFKVLTLAQLFLKSIRGFGINMLHAFHVCLVPTIAALFLVKDRATRGYLLFLFLPGFLTYALMEMGQSQIYPQFGRLVYSAYPAVYLLTAVALVRLAARLRPSRFPWLGDALSWSFVGLYLGIANLDVWGFPWIYYLIFYRGPAFSFQP